MKDAVVALSLQSADARSTMASRPATTVERTYVSFYVPDVHGARGYDQVVLKHPNGLCVVCLSPEHPCARRRVRAAGAPATRPRKPRASASEAGTMSPGKETRRRATRPNAPPARRPSRPLPPRGRRVRTRRRPMTQTTPAVWRRRGNASPALANGRRRRRSSRRTRRSRWARSPRWTSPAARTRGRTTARLPARCLSAARRRRARRR